MERSSVKFRKKLKKTTAIALTASIAISTSNLGVVFANESEVQNQEEAAQNQDSKVEITDFEVKLDGAGRVLVGFGIDKEVNLTNIMDNKDDIIIKLTTKSGHTVTKKKFTYDNYLNGTDNQQYGRFEKVPAGYYTTVFTDKNGKLDDIVLEDVQVDLIVRKDNIESKEIFYGQNMKPEVPTTPEETKLVEVTTNAPDQVLVKFDLNEEIDLASKSTDNIIIKAIDKNTGKVLTTKNKTWSGYLNNQDGVKFGRESRVPAGTYSTVFNKEQLEYITLEGIAIEFEVQKNGQQIASQIHGEIENNTPDPVQISNVQVNRSMEEHVAVAFDIDQAINLGLNTTDNIEIKAIDKNTGKTIVTKNKTWTGYLNSSEGKFGLGSVLKPGTYSTTFKPSDLRYTAPQDVVIEIAITNNDIRVEHTDGEIIENPDNTEKVVKIENLKSTPQGKGTLVEFEIDQVMDLKLNSKDDLVITAIDKETGDILTSKNKTWTKYLNDIAGNQFGLNNVIRAGKYATVFNEGQLRGVDPSKVIIEVKAIKEGITYSAATEEVLVTEAVKIQDVKVEEFNTEDVKVEFNIDKNINLKLTSKDNITIKAIDNKTGEVIKTKSKTWTDYLNNQDGEQFGLGELVTAGTYSNVFTKKQLGNKAIDEVIFEIVVQRDIVKTVHRTGKLNSGFEDLINQEHWANDEIAQFAAKGYLCGYEDGTFRADGKITRAEFIKVVNKVFGFTETVEENFTDVSKEDWYYNDVCLAVNAGYISGYPDGTFMPNKAINREEAAKIVSSIMNLKGDGELQFKDADAISDWAKEHIDALSDNLIIKGYDDGSFNPKREMTRGEAVVTLSRAEKHK